MGLEYGGRQPILDPDETRMVDPNYVHGSAIEMIEVIALLSNLGTKNPIDMQAIGMPLIRNRRVWKGI